MHLFRIVLFLLIVTTCIPSIVQAQQDREEIKAVVTSLFDSMRKSDTSAIRTLFASEEMVLKTVYKDKDGIVRLHEGSVKDFLRSVGTEHSEIYDERLAGYEIQRHGMMATMQVDYYFFVGTKFSHCGVNFFEFIRTREGWKIMNLADTRMTDNCEVPDETW